MRAGTLWPRGWPSVRIGDAIPRKSEDLMRKNTRWRTGLTLCVGLVLGYLLATISFDPVRGRTPATTNEESPKPPPKKALPTTTSEKPNIVFLMADNLGYGEVGCYGGGILRGAATPRIDRLASEGTRLTNFNVEAQCTPSRSAILTGRFSIRSGTHSVPIGGGLEGMTQWEVTIAELL